MNAVKCYKTSDGQIYEDKAQARRRQAELDLHRQASSLECFDCTSLPGDLAEQALACRKQIMELFRAEDAAKDGAK